MTSLAALAFATPIFGLSLQLAPGGSCLSVPQAAMQLPESALLLAQNTQPPAPLPPPAPVSPLPQPAPPPPAPLPHAVPAPGFQQPAALDPQPLDPWPEPSPRDIYVAQLRKRARLTKLHRPLGIATWVAMTGTSLGGAIQYYNLYGLFADQASNPCVTGKALFGQGQCSGTPWPHLIGGVGTALLYGATLSVALMMPDPDGAADGDSQFASTLRMHKLLRWVHLAGMVTQFVLGIVIANSMLGLDRASDYGQLRTLATVHLGTGLVTLGALTWAGALMF